MQLDITDFFNSASPMDYSASCAEIGQSAGADTWRAALDDSEEYPLLCSEEEFEAFRRYLRDTGGWTGSEIAAFTLHELNALCIQFVAGWIREAELSPASDSHDWRQYRIACQQGRRSSAIYQGAGDRIFAYVGV